MPSCFNVVRCVEFADTDCAGIAHFTVFFRYMEEVEHAFLRASGLSVRSEQEDGSVIGFPRLSSRCEYIRAVRFEDSIDIDLWVSRVGKKTIEYSCEFRHGGDLVALGRTVVIACRVDERRTTGRSIESIAIPASFVETLEVASRPPLVFRGDGEDAGSASKRGEQS